MAKNTTSSQVSSPIVRAPEGFRRLGSVANAGWFNMKEIGNTLQGTFEGMYQRKDDLNPNKVSDFFQIQVSVPCQIRVGRGDDAELATAQIGDFVNLNYGPKTKDLKNFVADYQRGAKFEVYGVVAGEKIKLTGGRTMHNFELFTKMVTPPTAAEEPDFDGATE